MILARTVFPLLLGLVASTADAALVLTPGMVSNALTGNDVTNTTFSVNGVSEWGNAASIDSGTQSLGLGPYNLGKTVGGIVTVTGPFGIKTYWGGQIGANLQGVAGLQYGVQANGGRLDIQYPVKVNLQFPNPISNSLTVGQTFSIGSSYTLSPVTTTFDYHGVPVRLTIAPSMAVHGPTLQSFAQTDLGFNAFAGAQLCAGTCVGPALGPIAVPEFSQEIVAVNRNGDGQLRLDGSQVSANQQFSDKWVKGTLGAPSLDAQGDLGADQQTLSANVQGNLFAATASLDKIIMQAVKQLTGVPIPDLNGSVGPLNYNLVTSNAGLSVDIAQQIQFAPAPPVVTLDFTSPVEVKLPNGGFSAPTTRVTFNAGDTIELRAPGAETLGVLPTFSLGGTATNTTSLDSVGQATFQALGLSLDGTGLTLGPLVNEATPDDPVSLNLANASFPVNFGQEIQGTPYNLLFSPDYLNPVGQHIDLCVDGCVNTGFLSFLNTDAWSGDTLAEGFATPQEAMIGIVDDPLTTLQNYLGCLNGGYRDSGLLPTPLSCSELLPTDFQAFDSSGLRVLDASGNDLFVGDLASLLAPEQLNIQANGTLADMYTQLADLGFTFGLPPFGPPPADMPEPGTLSLVAVSLLAAHRARSRLQQSRASGPRGPRIGTEAM